MGDTEIELSVFLQFLFSGLTAGAVYALVGISLNIVYNSTSIINLAQGEFVVLGGLGMWYFLEHLQLPFFLSFLLTITVAALLGLLMERLTIRPLIKKANLLLMIMVTIAVSILLKGLLMFKFGKDPYAYAPFTEGEPINIFGAVISQQILWVIGITFSLILLLNLFFNKTLLGKAMRACSLDTKAARLMGINVSRIVMLSFVISAIIGAVAGIAITPITLMEYDKGAILTVKGFTAAILGGLGTSKGAVFGGFLLGILESLTAGYIHSGIKDAVALLLLLIVLFFKPAGIFGSKEVIKLRKL
ncbi:branched-chain amino acid ABC transporter permease [Thermodesulfovibrio hydrogeniphilus]